MNSNTKYLVRSGLFLALAISFQLIGRAFPQISQYFVGSGVNAILLMSTFTCGTWWGIAISAFTPITALFVGQLAQPLAPFIPFIILGNIIFVLMFGIFKEYRNWGMYVGLILGAFLKFLFLFYSASKLVHVFRINLPAKVLKILATAMGIPQLITAIIGGIAATFIIKTYFKKKITDGGNYE